MSASLIVALLNFLVATFFYMFMFDETFVPHPFLIAIWLFVGGVGYWLSIQLGGKPKFKGVGKIFILSYGILIVQFFSSFVYMKWNFNNFLSPSFIMNLIMGSCTFLVFWFTYILILNERKNNKKIYNTRIGEEEQPTFLQHLFKRNKQEVIENDVTLILGVSMDKQNKK